MGIEQLINSYITENKRKFKIRIRVRFQILNTALNIQLQAKVIPKLLH